MSEDIQDYVHTVDPKNYRNPWHPDDPVKFSQVKRSWSLDFPWDEVSEELHYQLQNGRLTMKCPYCGQKEPAGPWCSQCGRMVRAEHWFKGTVEQAPVGEGKRRRGRPSKADVEAAGKVCDCG